MSQEIYECATCGYKSEYRHEFVEFKDPIKLPKVIDRAKAKGRNIKSKDVKYVCIKCSVEMYQEETKPPKSIKIIAPKSGEEIEVWL